MCKRKAVSYAKHLCQLREKMRRLPYREQLAQKQARLQELLGGFAPVKAVQGMAEPLYYRNKAIASFATQRGKLVCGLYAEGTHRVLPGADCLLQEEILNKTLAAFSTSHTRPCGRRAGRRPRLPLDRLR